jgi:TRAP-type transport system periplasmic protein
MTTRLRFALISIAVASLLAAGPHAMAQTKTKPKPRAKKPAATQTIKLATLAPVGSSMERLLRELGSEWKKASGGAVTLDVYAGGSAGGEEEVVRKMRHGQIHAALLTAVGLSNIDPSVEALQSIPLMFRSLEEVDYIGEKLQPRIAKQLRERGYVVLFWADAGWVRFYSRDPVLRPDDLKKAKLFTWAGDDRALGIYKAAGFNAVPLETTEIVLGLKNRMITAVPAPSIVALTSQYYSDAGHMLDLGWAPLVGGLIIHEKEWNKLDPQTQRELAKSAYLIGQRMRKQNRQESEEAIAEMVKRGLKVHRVTPAIEAEWRAVAEKAYPQIRGPIVPAELFDEVSRLLDERRAAAAQKAKSAP